MRAIGWGMEAEREPAKELRCLLNGTEKSQGRLPQIVHASRLLNERVCSSPDSIRDLTSSRRQHHPVSQCI